MDGMLADIFLGVNLTTGRWDEVFKEALIKSGFQLAHPR